MPTKRELKADKAYIQRQNKKREAALSALTPNPRTNRWLEAEDQIVQRTDITLIEKVVMLNRYWKTIPSRVKQLKNLGPRTQDRCDICGERMFEYVRHRGMVTCGSAVLSDETWCTWECYKERSELRRLARAVSA